MISATNSAAQPASQQQTTQQSKSSGLTSDFETFLLMLTTQARNQDPLKPLDSSEYASQLAQFSMVEQQVQTNSAITDLAALLGRVDVDKLSGWVGTDVQVVAPFQFAGNPITMTSRIAADADRASLVIMDEQGNVLDRVSVPVDDTDFVWDGRGSSGALFGNGTYTAAVESFKDGKKVDSQAVATYANVTEARIRDGQILLTLDGGYVVLADQVQGVRAAG